MNNATPEPSIEERKLAIEEEKLALARKTSNTDFFAKIVIPISVAVIALLSYITNMKAVDDRMVFDIDVKKTELRQKEEEIFLKKTDLARKRDSSITTFIQTNFALISSSSTDARRQSDILAKAVFSAADITDVMTKITQIRNSTPNAIATTVLSTTSAHDSYKADGLQFVKSSRFDLALGKFVAATVLNPTDAEAWNFKAYAEMRVGNPSEALKSISTSILLRPADVTLQHRVMLNATKILCTLGRTEDAASYLKKNIAVFPSLSAVVQQDGELQQRCRF